ncbi:MAG: glycosyltransferase family 4 protein [Bacteroidales bacterium]|nr:glycosyltransferase family 4 protein [Bacteroidales bacterium]
MKVVILGTAYPYRGGLAAFNQRLAEEYISMGHEVVIHTFSLQYPSFLFPGKTQYSDEPAPEGLTIKRTVNAINPLNWLRTGRRIKREEQPDLLIVKFWLPFMAPCLGTICRIVKRGGRTRVVSVLDNVIPHEKRPGDKLFARYFVRSVDGFVAMSRSVLSDLGLFDQQKPRAFCPHPLYDHYGAIMPRREAVAAIGLNESERYVLFFGFIRDYKGLDLLIDAFADHRLFDLGVKLIVAGEFYGDPEPYMSKIRSLDLADRIMLCTDFIPDSEVNRYFCAADIVAQPYRSATQSGVTQIAFHFETPMLVTNVGGLPEIVPDGKVGYVVEPDAQQIADALVRFYKEERHDEFVQNLRLEKQKYSWQNMTNAIDNLKTIKKK